ncbi:MAG: bifunctional oligoribonuclease/PAP phosphatase NrnA [Clostridiales bacterium]|jgi:phosphoesterase RecJ-like protein|nr:bifunctional oligoribonuclease/PAP phosphatase NrnA [Clostridiales bacterium]
MNENMKAVLEKIKAYDKIIIFRHFRPDGDAVGSTKGMQAMLQASYPDKKIYLQNSDFCDYMTFLGAEDVPLKDEEYADALGIVMDTATQERVSNQKFTLCKELVKIDHHIPVQSYGVCQWVEEERSSTCEMVAAFYDAFKDELKMTKEAATYIYTGMVTDSGRFRFRSVSGETMRLAGIILDQGIDVDTIYANLYMKDFEEFKFEAYAHKKMQISENGVASLFVTKAMKKKFKLTNEQASASVSFMDSIKNSLIWIAFIVGDDGAIRVRLRSRFVTVSELAEKYRGGGHACAAGATVYSKAEAKALLQEADALLKEYKAKNKGWL